MFSNKDDGVDDVLAQFIIMMYAKAATIAGDEKLRRVHERKREGSRLECPPVPRGTGNWARDILAVLFVQYWVLRLLSEDIGCSHCLWIISSILLDIYCLLSTSSPSRFSVLLVNSKLIVM